MRHFYVLLFCLCSEQLFGYIGGWIELGGWFING